MPVHQQWLGPNLIDTPLGNILSSLRDQVEQIAKLNYFIPTGIKKIANDFKLLDSNPLQQDEKEEIVALLKHIHSVTKERLQQNSNRSQLLHQFYTNTFVLMDELTKAQTEASDINYEQIQANAECLLHSDKSLADKEFKPFLISKDSFRNMLKEFAQKINDPKWNKRGLGFPYYRKIPDGIVQLQKMFNTNELDFLHASELAQPMALSSKLS